MPAGGWVLRLGAAHAPAIATRPPAAPATPAAAVRLPSMPRRVDALSCVSSVISFSLRTELRSVGVERQRMTFPGR